MMRIDKREAEDLREIVIDANPLRFAEGSCEIRWGRNRILCAVTVEGTVPKWLAGQGKGWVTAEYAMLPRSTRQRIVRDSQRSKPNSRALEIQRIIGRSLRAVVDLKALGERTITVDCDVIEADGGTRTACITGGYVALALAAKQMREQEQLGKNAKLLKDYVAAVSVGIVEGRRVVDLNYMEDSQAETDMNIVMTGEGRFVEVQGTAEGEAFPREELDALLDMGSRAVSRLVALQKTIVDIAGL
jgi:ribonuclease PH